MSIDIKVDLRKGVSLGSALVVFQGAENLELTRTEKVQACRKSKSAELSSDVYQLDQVSHSI